MTRSKLERVKGKGKRKEREREREVYLLVFFISTAFLFLVTIYTPTTMLTLLLLTVQHYIHVHDCMLWFISGHWSVGVLIWLEQIAGIPSFLSHASR